MIFESTNLQLAERVHSSHVAERVVGGDHDLKARELRQWDQRRDLRMGEGGIAR
jgi:hypothetical protein